MSHRFGIVGGGMIAPIHLAAIRALPGAQATGIMDHGSGRGKILAPELDATGCDDCEGDLLARVRSEAERAGRGDSFYLFHLGYPEISARYNAIGSFGRITEVASRIASSSIGASRAGSWTISDRLQIGANTATWSLS